MESVLLKCLNPAGCLSWGGWSGLRQVQCNAGYNSLLVDLVVYSSPSHLWPRSVDLAPGLLMDLPPIHMINMALVPAGDDR